MGKGSEADARAKKEVEMGEWMHRPDIVTPAGTRQAYTLHSRAPAYLGWSRQALRGQGAPTTVAEGNWEGRRRKLRV